MTAAPQYCCPPCFLSKPPPARPQELHRGLFYQLYIGSMVAMTLAGLVMSQTITWWLALITMGAVRTISLFALLHLKVSS